MLKHEKERLCMGCGGEKVVYVGNGEVGDCDACEATGYSRLVMEGSPVRVTLPAKKDLYDAGCYSMGNTLVLLSKRHFSQNTNDSEMMYFVILPHAVEMWLSADEITPLDDEYACSDCSDTGVVKNKETSLQQRCGCVIGQHKFMVTDIEWEDVPF